MKRFSFGADDSALQRAAAQYRRALRTSSKQAVAGGGSSSAAAALDSMECDEQLNSVWRRCRAHFLSRLQLSWRSSDESVGSLHPPHTSVQSLRSVCAPLTPDKLARVVLPAPIALHFVLTGHTTAQVQALRASAPQSRPQSVQSSVHPLSKSGF
jgi:hypothetical protein